MGLIFRVLSRSINNRYIHLPESIHAQGRGQNSDQIPNQRHQYTLTAKREARSGETSR